MSTAVSQYLSRNLRLFVVMGVAGCGKSTIAEALALRIGGIYLDGDSFHLPSNIAKMSAGTPLTDDDRWPWLETIGREMAVSKGRVVTACSALKRVYRERIAEAAGEPVLFVHLNGSRELISGRMGERTGHFMPISLLDSQFATLQAPAQDEFAISVDITGKVEEIVDRILEKLESL